MQKILEKLNSHKKANKMIINFSRFGLRTAFRKIKFDREIDSQENLMRDFSIS